MNESVSFYSMEWNRTEQNRKEKRSFTITYQSMVQFIYVTSAVQYIYVTNRVIITIVIVIITIVIIIIVSKFE
jgi:hypothetical protein